MAVTELKTADAGGIKAIDPATEKTWDEAQLTAAMERLQEMHIQVRSTCICARLPFANWPRDSQLRRLRDAIPALIRPFNADSATSPEQLYRDFRSAAIGSVDQVRQFRTLIQEPASAEVLAHARASREADHNGITSWLVEQHDNWLDETVLRSAKDHRKTEDELIREFLPDEGVKLEKEEDEADEKKGEDVASILNAFNDRHPDVDVKLLDSISKLMV